MPQFKLSKLIAMLLLGDGLYAMIHPHREPDAWWIGPKAWKNLLRAISERPALARSIGAVQMSLALGYLISTGERDDARDRRRR